jgi:hypothetical protein
MGKRTNPNSAAPVQPPGTGAALPAPPPHPSSGAATVEANARAPYTSPVLERLGNWSALTLQQSVPIFP